jgi:hypothetical protein
MDLKLSEHVASGVLIWMVLVLVVAVAVFVVSVLGWFTILALAAVPVFASINVKLVPWSYALLDVGRQTLMNWGVLKP